MHESVCCCTNPAAPAASLPPPSSSSSPAAPEAEADRLNAGHWLLLLVLATVQFTHLVDFMLLVPLAPQLETSLRVDTQSFGLLVAAYGLAAAVASLALAPWLDRFD